MRKRVNTIKYRMKKIIHIIKRYTSNFVSVYRIGLLLLVLFLLLSFSNIKIPNIFNISNVQVVSTIVSIIIGALASVLGIIIAVILV